MTLKTNLNESTLLQSNCECVVLFLTDEPAFKSSSQTTINLLEGTISRLFKTGDIQKKQGSIVLLYDVDELNGKKLLLVYVDSLLMTTESFTNTIDIVAKQLTELPIKHVGITLDNIEINGQSKSIVGQRILQSFHAATYQFESFKEASDDKVMLKELSLFTQEKENLISVETGMNSGEAMGVGKNLARDLGNMPANICHPSYLANLASQLSQEYATLTTVIIDEKEMEALGMNAFLSVGQGSEQPSKLIVMNYQNGPQEQAPIALVGKGITFDSGGISIKPGAAMDEMKFDMCGAAAVFGTLKSVLHMQLPINLVCVIAAAENMPSASATRPGDIVKSMSGKTIEILNTDAEGRLVLCDALTYVQQYKPKAIIDVATLTGACVVALGEHATGLLSNDDSLAQLLSDSGNNTGDKVWSLPLWPEYTKKLESNFADLANIGSPGAGSITAGCFLAEFVKDVPWAHLDIAGTAWLKGANKGATGRPVALLVDYLLKQVD